MNRVIRTARISEHPVVLPIHVERDVVELPFVADDEFTEADFEAAQTQDVEASSEFTALGDQAEVVDEPVEEEPKLSMDEVEALIAERVGEVEARLLQEKAQETETARQAGLEEGQTQGYAEGHAAGLAEGQAQSQDEIARFQALTHHMATRWDLVFKSADLDVTQLAFAIARNIVSSVVDAQEDLVLDAVRDCLAHVQDVTKLTICVNPDDLEIVRANRTHWQEAYERIASMNIEADAEIERGGCVIETPAGDIDGQISSRLEKLQTAILERLQGLPSETAPDVSDVVAESQNESTTEADEAEDNDLNVPPVAENDETVETVQSEEPEQDTAFETPSMEEGMDVGAEQAEEGVVADDVVAEVDDLQDDAPDEMGDREREDVLPEPNGLSGSVVETDLETDDAQEDDAEDLDASVVSEGLSDGVDLEDEAEQAPPGAPAQTEENNVDAGQMNDTNTPDVLDVPGEDAADEEEEQS